MIRPKGLGRGLDALLAGADDASASESLQTLAIDRLRPGKYQPRTRMDEASLDELAQSIREHGIMQPDPRAAGRGRALRDHRRRAALARGAARGTQRGARRSSRRCRTSRRLRSR